jgi:hypothetical protein
MTDEQRLDQLERIVKLMIKAGLRARRQSREQDEKINILINFQIRNDELFAKNEERFAKNGERFAKNEETLAALAAKTEEKFAALAESQKSLANTVERIIVERGNGKP